ncbi:MAG: KpsF/GutQ family sugar-phosphate isomerase [Candidatus Hydrogenedentes bacterium]|nr:KpsF/GutQ family sugar-phosphate isomerase [Candidatus Hydrogenedentota bacterium]
MDIQSVIRRSLAIERDAVAAVLEKVGEECERAVMALHACPGHVIVTGVGKAGLVGRKLAATLSSTGTAAVFLHAGEALHGDLGVVHDGDVVIAVSNSGESKEIVELLPYLRRLEITLIALTGVTSSSLARQSDIVIDVGVSCEADTLGLAPTASTTAAMALGDALAAGVMRVKRFTREQYARNHPGGSLGTLLLARVEDLMVARERTPAVSMDVTMRDAIYEMTSRRLGATFVIDERGKLVGIITDGDLRRLLQRDPNPLGLRVTEVMTRNPKRIRADALAVEAMRMMEDHVITILPVVDDEERPISAIHMHDLVKAGLALWSGGEE